MSSTGQTTSSASNIQLIIDVALADYTKITGTDLSKTSFAAAIAAIERSNSPEAILQLLQEREKAFKEHREGNRRLINCLSPAVSVIQAFSGILGEAASLVSHTCHLMNPFQINSDLIRSPSHQQTLCLLALILSLLYVLSIPFSRGSPVMNEYARLPVGSHRATMLFSNCLSAWGTSSSVWRSIRRSHLVRY
jgi:hypothetical protein